MSHISVDTFDVLDGPSGRSTRRTWLNEVRDLSRPEVTIEGVLEKIAKRLETVPTVYHLHDLGETAHHSTGWIIDDPYLELVAINLSAGVLHLVAGGGD